MADLIDWEAVLKRCQWLAAEGHEVIGQFQDERTQALLGDGSEIVWPSRQEAFRHFAENRAAWELVEQGYDWRILELRDLIHKTRKKVLEEKIDARSARVAIDTAFSEIKMAESKRPKTSNQSDDVADRLTRAQTRLEAVEGFDAANELMEKQDAQKREAARNKPKKGSAMLSMATGGKLQ